MNREYKIGIHFTNDKNKKGNFFYTRVVETEKCMKEELTKEYTEHFNSYYNSVGYNISSVFVEALPNCRIDWDLIDIMDAVRSMCDLGNRVRADTKLKSRQVLRTAYILFSNYSNQEYMIYKDAKHTYEDIFKNELNVLNVEFPDEQEQSKFFNYNLKPNFKVLGPKGYGKQAQGMKKYFEALSVEDRNNLYIQFKNLKEKDSINIIDVPIVLSDLEVEFIAKKGFMSASGKVGAVILDTNLDQELIDMGFIVELKSTIQGIRKEQKLNITDRIEITICCGNRLEKIIEHFSEGLKSKLLAKEIYVMYLENAAGQKYYYHKGTFKKAELIDSQEGFIDIKEIEEVLFIEVKKV